MGLVLVGRWLGGFEVELCGFQGFPAVEGPIAMAGSGEKFWYGLSMQWVMGASVG